VTPVEYKSARQQRGTQQGVALALGVDYRTIQRREAGDIPITVEAGFAMLYLKPLRKKKRAPRRPNQRSSAISGRKSNQQEPQHSTQQPKLGVESTPTQTMNNQITALAKHHCTALDHCRGNLLHCSGPPLKGVTAAAVTVIPFSLQTAPLHLCSKNTP
jgi:hypothetical protein